ncbi:MAG TPA: hypothetical protein ENJ00_08460 [Phycisphaerales bacterium]|nr:hypothetical protein [Phycisphaerales bacterium]
MGTNRHTVNDVERRLRADQPGHVEPPGWVRPHVLAGIDRDTPEARSMPGGWAVLVGALGVAVLVIGVIGVFRMTGQSSATTPQAKVRIASAEEFQTPTAGPAINLSIPTKVLTPGTLERETQRLRQDVVQLADVVRKPIRRLGMGLSRF